MFLPLASESEHHTSSSSFLMMSVRPSMIASRMCLVASSNILTCSGSDLSKRLNRGCLMRLLRSFFHSSLHEKKFCGHVNKVVLTDSPATCSSGADCPAFFCCCCPVQVCRLNTVSMNCRNLSGPDMIHTSLISEPFQVSFIFLLYE